MALSEFSVRKAKPRDRSFKLTDGGGLYLQIHPSGSKLWRMKYRYLGKEKLLSFGSYPLVSIADARRKRDDAKRLLLENTDPGRQKKLDRLDAAAKERRTFGLIADEYLERLREKGASPATVTKVTWLLKNLAASLSQRPIHQITPAELLSLLQSVEKSGRRETARRLRGTISSIFKFAIVTLRAGNDPTVPLHGALLPPKIVGRAAITDERKFGALLRSIDEYDGWPTITAALKFLILTCVRPGEVRGAVRSEFDLRQKVWRIPAERMKMRVPHDVPLSRQAMGVLQDVWPFSEGAVLVFPSIRSKSRPLSENAFNAALRRLGYSKNEVTAHGFRVTASSILNSRGFNADVIEAVLAHQDRNSIRRNYNRASYWDQRMVLLQQWADLMDELRAV